MILTLERMRDDVADLLGAPVVDDAPLIEQGLDSIRLMTLVERWRAMGVAVTFAELAEHPTLAEWGEVLRGESCHA
jgi:bifunctional isochorismate lyase/aryl carrier protein